MEDWGALAVMGAWVERAAGARVPLRHLSRAWYRHPLARALRWDDLRISHAFSPIRIWAELPFGPVGSKAKEEILKNKEAPVDTLVHKKHV